jgi:hypothetical protein
MPTVKQQLVFKALSENIGSNNIKPLGTVLIEAGYSKTVSETPNLVLKSKGFQELLDDYLPDADLITTHKKLLETKRIDHLVFPVAITDEEITELVESVGGTVRKIAHGETANHVWFWIANDKARHDALKLAYDLKGKLGKRDTPEHSSTYNTFIQNNNVNPEAPGAKELAAKTLETLMELTKRKVD